LDTEPKAAAIEREGKMTHRKKKGSDTWHFCKNCSNWPTKDYQQKFEKPSSDELCDECRAKRRNRECE